jgi:hemerythrin-like domain-containing protein
VTVNAEDRVAFPQNECVKAQFSPIQMLRDEHRMILRACNEADALAESLLLGHDLPAEALFALDRYFSDYVADRHRAKETGVLLPLIERRHGPEAVAISLRDHEEGLWWVRCLNQVAEAYSRGCSAAGRRWAETAVRYASMLREQIESEENSLFPLIEGSIDASLAAGLCQAFDEIDQCADERPLAGSREVAA